MGQGEEETSYVAKDRSTTQRRMIQTATEGVRAELNYEPLHEGVGCPL
jgi:hypothetical protein